MFIASDGLECSVARLEVHILATTQTRFMKAKTYVVCNMCKMWDRYGL